MADLALFDITAVELGDHVGAVVRWTHAYAFSPEYTNTGQVCSVSLPTDDTLDVMFVLTGGTSYSLPPVTTLTVLAS